ncbi:hypothetical protein DYB37_013736, partial [Aphanomyces astaci]
DVYPVFMFKPQGSTEVTLTPGPGGSKRTLKLNLQQLPFVNAIASTIYKIQGETMESLVVADWKARGSKVNKVVNTCQQGYIAISRLTKRDGFSALKPLTNECIRYFQPSSDTIAENLRLEKLFAVYLSRNENTAVFNSSDFNALKKTLPASDARYGFYDSLHSPRPTVLTTLQRFVDTLDGRQGQLHGMEIPGPQQHNGYDCGVFVCIAAKQFIQTYSTGPFEHDDMAVWRLHILNCIAHFLPLASRP